MKHDVLSRVQWRKWTNVADHKLLGLKALFDFVLLTSMIFCRKASFFPLSYYLTKSLVFFFFFVHAVGAGLVTKGGVLFFLNKRVIYLVLALQWGFSFAFVDVGIKISPLVNIVTALFIFWVEYFHQHPIFSALSSFLALPSGSFSYEFIVVVNFPCGFTGSLIFFIGISISTLN